MRNTWMVFAAACCCFPTLVVNAFADGPPDIVTGFDSDLEGWTVIEDGTTSWQPTGGNPDGWMRIEDLTEGDWIWAKAPSRYLGDWAARGLLSVDLRLISGTPGYNVEFRISGPGGSASFDSGLRPTMSWTTYSAVLSEQAWDVTSGTWAGLLANVTDFMIRAEFRSGAESCGIDNVVLLGAFNAIVTHAGPVHLGDDVTSGCDPASPSGTMLSLPFSVPVLPDRAFVSLDAGAVGGGSYVVRVLLNGTELGIVSRSPSNVCTTFDSHFAHLCTPLLVPGSNTLVIETGAVGGNYDDIWVRNIVVATSLPTGDPFQIVSATSNKTLYQNGVESAVLTITTRSSWGQSDSLRLSIGLEPSLGPTMSVGEDRFALSPGEEHVSVFSWPVPDSSYAWEFDGTLGLFDDEAKPLRSEILTQIVREWFGGNPLSAEIINEYQDGAQACLSHQMECYLRYIACFPFVGRIASLELAANDICRMDQFAVAGQEGNVIGAFWASQTKLGKQLVLEVTYAVLESFGFGAVIWTTRIIHGVGELARNCWGERAAELLGWIPAGPRGQRDALAVVDSLASWTRVGIDSLGADVADALFVSGNCRLRIEADSSWSSQDSLGLVFARAETIDTLAAIALTTRHVFAIGGTEEANPRSAAVFHLSSVADQTIGVALLHQNQDGQRTVLRYAPFGVQANTTASLAVQDDQEEFPLIVDLDGDGNLDQIHYPGGIVVGVDEPESEPVTNGSLIVAGNPAQGDVGIVYSLRMGGQVRVRVYDVLGRIVRTLVDERVVGPGTYRTTWDTRGERDEHVPPGVYFCRLETEGTRLTRQLVVVR